MTGPQFLAWRSSLGMSQEQAAEALGLNRRTVQRYETGSLPVPLSVRLAARWLAAEKQLRSILLDH